MYGKITEQLVGVANCPFCGRANPSLILAWRSDGPIPRGDGEECSMWATYRCTSCGHLVTAKGKPGQVDRVAQIIEVFPKNRVVAQELPERARKYLDQAIQALHTPDGAAMLCGSAVDAMLKKKGYEKASVYDRIDQAVQDHQLTKEMGDWAHSVRLGSNRPRHADEEDPHVTEAEAKQSVEFTEALGQFLFVLPARADRVVKSVPQPKKSVEAVNQE